MMRVGLAMLQGARHEHEEAVLSTAMSLNLDVEVIPLRKAEDLDSSIQGLILPGGESTTMRIASRYEGLLDSIYEWMETHPDRPVLGTCAGAILLAVPSKGRSPFIQAKISRNAWGRQRQSFEAQIDVSLQQVGVTSTAVPRKPDAYGHTPLAVGGINSPSGDGFFPGVFIRAPRFDAEAIKCEIIARFGDEIVGVRDGSKCAVTFHPELTADRRFHAWLLEEISSLSTSE